MSVRTAASASSREGRGSTGTGADRTCSDKPCFGHSFTLVFFTSMTGLSVRPAFARRQRRECHRGGRVSYSAAAVPGNRGFWTPHSHSAWLKPCRRREPLLAPSGQPLYIQLRGRGNPPILDNR